MLLKSQNIANLIFYCRFKFKKNDFVCLRLENCIYTIYTETIQPKKYLETIIFYGHNEKKRYVNYIVII